MACVITCLICMLWDAPWQQKSNWAVVPSMCLLASQDLKMLASNAEQGVMTLVPMTSHHGQVFAAKP